MTDSHKVLPFPTRAPADPEFVAGLDISALTRDILDAARLAALDAAAERLPAADGEILAPVCGRFNPEGKS